MRGVKGLLDPGNLDSIPRFLSDLKKLDEDEQKTVPSPRRLLPAATVYSTCPGRRLHFGCVRMSVRMNTVSVCDFAAAARYCLCICWRSYWTATSTRRSLLYGARYGYYLWLA